MGGQLNINNADVNTNNLTGRTAGQIGVAADLTYEGGFSNVLALTSGDAVDYCTSDTTTSLPIVDQRDYFRDDLVDAGAFELGGTILGVSNQDIVSISIYPNPTSGVISIKGAEDIYSIKVYSIVGTLEKEVFNTNQIDISELSSGIHLLQINAGTVFTKKVVKL
jgi:hypothetical protein